MKLNSTNNLSVFLFDLDGTLWNSKKAMISSIQDTFTEYKRRKPQYAKIAKELNTYGSPLRVLRNHNLYNDSAYWRIYKNHLNKIKLYKNVRSTINHLHKLKKRIGYVTSLKRELAVELLERFKLNNYHVLITPSDCHVFKPSPKPILKALKKLKKPADKTIYIGDRETDIKAAQKAGCISGLICRQSRGNNSIEPDFKFKSIRQVLRLAQKR